MERFEYKFTRRPPFLEGCFHWKERGYSYASVPDVALLSRTALASDDPWVRFAATIEFAKRGDRGHIRGLADLLHDDSIAPTLLGGVMDFIADAGERSDLEILVDMMLHGSGYLRIEAVRAARWSGVLWLIPFFLEALDEDSRTADRDAVEAAVSALLDLPGGEPEFFDTSESLAAYAQRVTRRVNELSSAAGTDEAAVFAGELIDMKAMIWHMHAQLREPSGNLWGDFLLLRHKFEAYTGADCSTFYANGDFQPLSARAVIEEFMRAHPNLPFKVGERHFFMRRVPRSDR